MDTSDVIRLVAVSNTTDTSGTTQKSIDSFRDVYCRIGSVGIKESYAAMAVGHNPEVKAILSESADYNGENYVKYAGAVYKVLRTYRTGLSVELTLERTDDLKGLI